MLRFFARKLSLGIEITSSGIRIVVVSHRGADISVLVTKMAELPVNMVNDTYASPNLCDVDGFSAVLRECLANVPASHLRRAALSLPDSVFRVQTLEFDELP